MLISMPQGVSKYLGVIQAMSLSIRCWDGLAVVVDR